MNEEQQNVNEFEDLFKTHDIKPKPDMPVDKTPYVRSIIYYLVVYFILATIIFFIFAGIDGFRTTYNQDEIAVTSVAEETAALTMVPSTFYDQVIDEYDSYVVSVGQYGDMEVIVNIANTYAQDYLQDDDQFIVANFQAILTGTRTTWDDNGVYDIIIFESSLSPFPDMASVERTLINEPYDDLTDFAYALNNFVIYLALAPVLALILLKRDITADLLVYKNKWGEFLSATLIGYALVLVGNYLGSFISSLFAQAFGVMQSTASNQMIIEQTLKSGGMVFMFISAVILGPIVEELIFRKSIFALFKSDKVGLVVSSLIFGSIHLLNETNIADMLINGSVYIILGFVFGYIYIRNNKNVALTITVHILSNLVSVLTVLLLL